MQKHAYLIIANRNPGQLQTLLTLLDDSRNDIYLLVDRKSVGYPRDFQLNYATLFSVSPLVIDWGSYSQVEAEMRLFQAAAPGKYAYYHLLSGLDLPLANQDEIHAFFAAHPGKEFITYSSQESGAQLLTRVQKYHFTHNFRQPNKAMRLFRKIEKAEQRVFPVRKKFAGTLAFGSQWVSLENDLVQVLLREDDRIRTMFDRGFLVDELLVPTMLNIYPEFKSRIYYDQPVHDRPEEFQGSLRYINWWDGRPYVWREKDYETLLAARRQGHLFSRKFDAEVDKAIIDKIAGQLLEIR